VDSWELRNKQMRDLYRLADGKVVKCLRLQGGGGVLDAWLEYGTQEMRTVLCWGNTLLGIKFEELLDCLKHQQNALHFRFYYALIDSYICFGFM
jgi:hypothetical protein